MSDGTISVSELRSKDVVNIIDGYRLGYLHDVNFDPVEGKAKSIIILGQKRFFGLFGRDEDHIIPWTEIRKIGADVILIEIETSRYARPRAKRRVIDIGISERE